MEIEWYENNAGLVSVTNGSLCVNLCTDIVGQALTVTSNHFNGKPNKPGNITTPTTTTTLCPKKTVPQIPQRLVSFIYNFTHTNYGRNQRELSYHLQEIYNNIYFINI